MFEFIIAGTGLPEIITLAEDVCKHDSRYRLLGFIDDNPLNASRNLYGYQLLGGFEVLRELPGVYVVNSIGRSTDVRASSNKRIGDLGGVPMNLIHPSCTIACCSIGSGNVIERGVILSKGATVGDGNLFLSDVILGHDSTVGNNCFIGHRVVINGHTVVRDESFIGAGSVLGPAITVEERSTIGPGCVINFNTAARSKFAARPAVRIS